MHKLCCNICQNEGYLIFCILPVSLNGYYLNVPFYNFKIQQSMSNVNMHKKLSVILTNEASY